ncbi:MAG: hypothetical protein JWP31_2211 [Aeromicrobium sp.]|nr:hypothetical protein [Aeromicrobium sp.]
MHTKIEKAGALSGVALLVLFGIFFLLVADFIPPLSPEDSADEIAAIYADNDVRIRIGLGLMVLTAPIVSGFIASIARQVRRVEGYWGVLSLTQIITGVVFPIGFIFPTVVAIVAAYRPDRDPEITQALNDVFWMMFIGIVGTLVLQSLILAAATFMDKREVPVFPRWFGYLNLWYALLALPGGAVFFFRSGPLAWNGVFAFWIPLAAFTAWMLAVTWALLKAVDHEEAELSADVVR